MDRKTRNIQLSIKQKDMADEQGAMASLSQQASRESAGTTSLGALLRAKLTTTPTSKACRNGLDQANPRPARSVPAGATGALGARLFLASRPRPCQRWICKKPSFP